ncbi:aldose 1-epimerase [Tenacibaculum sp. 190524A02b]|uniref:Aldose 1-epimerase n=1 Tax=Tenacibaculum vairaonense TaxID=3137860 RepID=A0ABP1FHB8_9FLAO
MEEKKNSNCLVSLRKGGSQAFISLENGGSLTRLFLKQKEIIKDFSAKHPYVNSFASAILFPFANRVFKGEYMYKKEKYTLKTNHEINAIHGLIYDKKFVVDERYNNVKSQSVRLKYINEERIKGFPFRYSVMLTYILYDGSISLEVEVKNIDEKPFPFTIGWHPYFYTYNKVDTMLTFNGENEVIHNDYMIPIEFKKIDKVQNFSIGSQKLDNCYALQNGETSLITPEYAIDIKSSHDNNYIQVYTPDLDNYIAVEPLTGIADSFNNKVGLQELNPEEIFTIKWTIELQDA